jgi:hypothetical protein
MFRGKEKGRRRVGLGRRMKRYAHEYRLASGDDGTPELTGACLWRSARSTAVVPADDNQQAAGGENHRITMSIYPPA